MAWLSRMVNALRGEKLNREIDEEFAAHIAEAVADGLDEQEARQAFGPMLRQREASHTARAAEWLEKLWADAIFGWRQLKRNKVTSAAAILSLALAMGACTAGFRLIDALLWRPLPVTLANRLYALSRRGVAPNGRVQSFDGWAHPAFQEMRAAVKGKAELIAVSYTEPTDVTYGADEQTEKANVQYVSGWMFGTFGLQPALGRLLREQDDETAGAKPYAVLSYDYWAQRFGHDPAVIGRTLRLGGTPFEIVGVGPKSFTGTEPGTVTDIFLPMMMNAMATRDDATWHRTLVVVMPGVATEPLRQQMDAVSRAFEAERAKKFSGWPKERLKKFLNQTLLMQKAASGVSDIQAEYGQALEVLGLLVGLVLLIACVNVASLMTAQAAARAREMALRVSIGAGRRRLVELMLVQSAMMAVIAAALGMLFAAWVAPMVVNMISTAETPVTLALPMDWRVLRFGLVMIGCVTLLFGLWPALRAARVEPASVMKGGNQQLTDGHGMHGMIAGQVAFCFLVVFVCGLMVATFQKLTALPMGFTAERLLNLESVTQQPQPAVVWTQAAEKLRATPGVEQVALASWPLLDNRGSNNFVAVNGAPSNNVLAYFLQVSPGWVGTMKIPLLEGRDFRPEDTSPGAAIVSETFAKTYFNGEDPVGKSFDVLGKNVRHYQVVGIVRDACYRSLREPTLPVAYLPFAAVSATGASQPVGSAVFMVRTAGNPMAMAATLRRRVAQVGSGLRVSTISSQQEIVRSQTVREKLLALLAVFFAGLALLLSSVGLFGMVHHSVQQRRREMGIRLAIGAGRGTVARLLATGVTAMVGAGVVVGAALGLGAARYVRALFFQVNASDLTMLAIPCVAIGLAAAVAVLPGILRAMRIDPAEILRSE